MHMHMRMCTCACTCTCTCTCEEPLPVHAVQITARPPTLTANLEEHVAGDRPPNVMLLYLNGK